MFVIDYNIQSKKFELGFSAYLDEDDFRIYNQYLSKIFLSWDSNSRNWIIPYKRINEILLWFIKDNYKYSLTSRGQIEVLNIIKSYKSEIKFNRLNTFDDSILNDGIELYEYQKYGINWLLKRNRSYLADDAGLGKTLQSIAWFSHLYKKGVSGEGILIIVRNGTTYHWLKQILMFVNLFKEDDIQLIDNSNKKYLFTEFKNKKIIILPNHLVGDAFISYAKKKPKKLSTLHWNKPYFDLKKEWNKKSISLIVDEAHEFKNPTAVKTKALYSAKEYFDNQLFMSATPAINKFEDWWSPFNCIDESLFSMSHNAFKIYISESIGDSYGLYNIKSYNSNVIQTIKDKLNPYVLKRLKKDLPEMKTKQEIIPIYMQMNPLQTKLYRIYMQYKIKELQEEYENVTPELIFKKYFYIFLQVVENPLLLHGKVNDEKFNSLLNKWKIEKDSRTIFLDSEINDVVNNLDEKMVIFDNHPLTLHALADRYKKYNPLIVTGETKDTAKSKQEKQDLFNDKNSKHKLFFITTQIGGASWNLNEACRRITTWSLPYDVTLTRQFIDRCYRITNVKDAIVKLLILDHTIDIYRYEKNINRMELNDDFFKQSLSKERLKQLLEGVI